jgi:hypothetical protein
MAWRWATLGFKIGSNTEVRERERPPPLETEKHFFPDVGKNT